MRGQCAEIGGYVFAGPRMGPAVIHPQAHQDPAGEEHKPWFEIRATAQGQSTCEVLIYDDIGMWGVTARHFAEALNAVEPKPTEITVRINSYGGEIFDALAIHNTLKNHGAQVRVQVDGIAASAATIIAMAGDTIGIAKNAWMMVHNAMIGVFGYASDLRKQADLLDRFSGNIADMYALQVGDKKTLDQIKAAMNDETWLDADEALAFGLVDQIEEEDDEDAENRLPAAAFRAAMKFQKTPAKLRSIAARLIEKSPPTPAGQKPAPISEASMAAKTYLRDGKCYLKIGESEVEVEMPAAGGSPAAAPAAAAPAGSNAPVNEQEIRQQAVAQERQYRTDFTTAMATAKLSGEAAAKFEKDFYGRPIEDVKFLASNAIGQRAQAVGEASGANGSGTGTGAEAAAAQIRAQCGQRFAEDHNFRAMFGCTTSNAEDPKYKAALARYVERELKYADDLKPENQKKQILRAKE